MLIQQQKRLSQQLLRQKSLWLSEVILKVTSLTRKHHYVHEIVEVIVAESCGSSQLPFPEPTGCSKQISNSIKCQSREDEERQWEVWEEGSRMPMSIRRLTDWWRC